MGYTNSSHFGGWFPQRPALSYARGWRRTATPSTTPPQRGRRMPGLELGQKPAAPFKQPLPEISRDGHEARPVEVGPPAGATDASGTSSVRYQPAPTGKATKRMLSPFFTRISTLRFPSVRALAMTLRTSAGVETAFPAISRMTSPVARSE